MPAGQELLEFSDALLGPDKNRMDQARLAVEDALGHQGVVAATAIAADGADEHLDARVPVGPRARPARVREGCTLLNFWFGRSHYYISIF